MISGFLEFYIPYIHASHTMWHCHTPCYSLLTLQNHSILSVNYVVLIRIRISTARGCNLPLGFLDKDRLVKGIRKCVTWKWKCVTCHPSMILSLHFKCHTYFFGFCVIFASFESPKQGFILFFKNISCVWHALSSIISQNVIKGLGGGPYSFLPSLTHIWDGLFSFFL